MPSRIVAVSTLLLSVLLLPPAIASGSGSPWEQAPPAGLGGASTTRGAGPSITPFALLADFSSDPADDPGALFEGGAQERLNWNQDEPVFAGDAPGSLSVLYASDLPAGRLGWRLEETLSQDDAFSAVAVFVLQSDHLNADPFGFFEISWGLWNSDITGLDRTGNFENPAADTFELMEFDYFPNVSPFFGGPWLSPSAFGAADTDNPLYPVLGAFANMTFGSVETALPLDVPLAAVIEYRPDLGAVVVRVLQLVEGGGWLPVDGAVTVMPLSFMSRPEFTFDTAGLTLWHDGYGGPSPALDAEVVYHLLTVRKGRVVHPEELLDGSR